MPQYRQPESSTKAETASKGSDAGDGTTQSATSQPNWLGENIWTPVQENVLNPMANGTGAVRIYNTFAPADRQAKEAKWPKYITLPSGAYRLSLKPPALSFPMS